MKIRPLTGQVLVKLQPPETISIGGVVLPSNGSDYGQKSGPLKGEVIAIGPWKQTKNGLQVLPPFGVGATVLLSPYVGLELNRDIGEQLRLVRSEDVIAVETKENC